MEFRRKSCGNCGEQNLQLILDMGDSPPANSPDVTQMYPLQLGACQHCWLVQQMTVLPDEVLFGGTYHFYSSASQPKVRYHRQLAATLIERHKSKLDCVVEVACNDGDLLRHFKPVARTVVGVEPARGPANVALDRDLDVVQEPFGLSTAERLREAYGPATLLIANHVMAHIVDVHDFVAGIAHLLAPDGVAVIEVQYLVDMMLGNQLDHVYHEHRYHWSLSSLTKLFATHDLYVQNAELVEPQGGSLRVTVGKKQLLHTNDIAALYKSEYWLNDRRAYRALQPTANRMRDRLSDLIVEEWAEGRTVAGYGATAKSTTLLNWCGIKRNMLQYIVDTTPHKAGSLTPGTGIPIVAPGEREQPDTYLMLAWNYASHILRKERDFMDRGGRWIVPIPYPTVI